MQNRSKQKTLKRKIYNECKKCFHFGTQKRATPCQCENKFGNICEGNLIDSGKVCFFGTKKVIKWYKNKTKFIHKKVIVFQNDYILVLNTGQNIILIKILRLYEKRHFLAPK